jgi:hypothetical protein
MEDAPPDLYQREHAEVVYFVGCFVVRFSPRVQRIAESVCPRDDAVRVDFHDPGRRRNVLRLSLKSPDNSIKCRR